MNRQELAAILVLVLGLILARWPVPGLILWLLLTGTLLYRYRPSLRWDRLLVSFLALLALAAPVLAFYPQGLQMEAPGAWPHLLGMDRMGRDVFSRLLYANRNSMGIAAIGSLFACFNGILVSAIMVLGPRWLHRLIDTLLQAILSIPILVFYLLGLVFMTPGPGALIVLLGSTLWPNIARLIQVRIRELSRADFVTVARMQGLSERRIFFREIAPNLKPVLLANFLVTLASAVLLESILGYLGMGLSVGVPSLGNLIQTGARTMDHQPQILIVASLVLLAWLMSFRSLLKSLGNRYQALQVQ